MKRFSLNSRSSFLFSYKNRYILKKGSFILLQSRKCSEHFLQKIFWGWKISDLCFLILCLKLVVCPKQNHSQVLHISIQYVNNVLAVTVELTFVMPYHGLIVCFKFKKFARLEISTSVINIIIAGEREGDRGFSSNFAFVRIFRKFLGCLVASFTVLFWKHCFNSLLLMFSRLRVTCNFI